MEDNIKLLKDTIDKIQEVTDLFYQQNNKEAYQQFQTVLDKITMVADAIYPLSEVANEDKNRFLNYMRDAMGALENKDPILLSDILQYDMKDLLEEMLGKLQ